MDGHQFDSLARSLSRSRRSLLGLGAALGFAPLVADAKKRKKKKKKCKGCTACQSCKKGKCLALPDQTPCGGGNLCDAGVCRAPRCGDPGIDCLVFISSERYTGNLGGLAGADAKCQNLANAAGIPGQFMAWLSDSTASPSTRFPTRSSGAYRLINGVKIADNWADLTDGTLDAWPAVQDDGAPAPGDLSWTGTLGSGQGSGWYCDNWTSADAGDSGSNGYHRKATDAGGVWSNYQVAACSADFRLYCFQQA